MDDRNDYQKFAYAVQKERELIRIQQTKKSGEEEERVIEARDFDRVVGLFNTANLSDSDDDS